MMTAGAGYTAAPKLKPVCGCTDANHQQVRDAIREQHLLTIAAVYEHLNWRTPNGCASCRPAINYYLISTWPHEALDDPQSRFINERAHANIQKNGTFSVVPRMWARRDQRRRSCGGSPTSSTSTGSPRSRSPAASASTCSG